MRTAFGIAYDGSDFTGWQSQQHGRGVQNLVDRALSQVAGHPVQSVTSGRTDTGVHASQQIIHCDHDAARPGQAWLYGANNVLPPSIRVLWAMPQSEHFDARFSALSRRYQYILLNQSGPSALEHRYTSWYFRPLRLQAMQEAACFLLGTHDFSAFRSVHCQSHAPERSLYALEIVQYGNRFVFSVEASGFLHNMVRILVGTLINIGCGAQPPGRILEILESKDRLLAGVTQPPNGLFYCGARYAPEFGLPGPLDRVGAQGGFSQ